eukprot:TRINITY_DN70254_c0_g1_i1.p1 TRINITY_DN70254_c0_g1~~TRINITY_DN70254_c0_g1_i1.p1  ORF type:complete len:268 (+),score=33.79 TRINITY_DN70254_c0_g1_i1:113-916(+)
MVMPLGGSISGDIRDAQRERGQTGAEGPDGPMFKENRMVAPADVKMHCAKYFWVLSINYLVLGVALCVARDWPGAFNAVIMAVLVWHLVRNHCEKMSQCCILFMGVTCVFHCVIAIYTLQEALRSGRVVSRERRDVEVDGKKGYQVVVEKSPFWDDSKGDYYLYQSAMMAVPIIFWVVGAILAKIVYDKFPASLWTDEGHDGEGESLNGGGSKSTAAALYTGEGQRLNGPTSSIPSIPWGGESCNESRATSADMRAARLAKLGSVEP